jgi:glycerol-3-phosphate O-acyltransferase
LQIEAERKRMIDELKADIKEKESRLKVLESIDDKRRKYGY